MSTIALGQRIRTVRLAADVGQAELAEHLGLKSNGLVSKIENDRAAVDNQQLRLIAERLDCTPELLLRDVPESLATRPWLRAYADAPATVVQGVLADNQLVHEFIDHLGLLRVPDALPLFRGDLNDDAAIERFALEVRAAAGVAEGDRVGNAMRTAERLGCVVLPLADELGRHLGLSQRIDGHSYLRASRARPKVPGDRQRFTVMHEVGHLALHSGLGPPQNTADARLIEKQAHLFASAALAPADALLEHWHQLGGRVTLSVLQQLKAHWGVAVKAFVVRFQQLDVIDSAQATALYKQISKRGWNTGEPVPVSNEQPVWLSRALLKRYGVGEVATARTLASGEYGVGDSHLDRWVGWARAEELAPSEPGAVLEMRPRLGDVPERDRTEGRGATVTPMRRRRS